LCPSAYGGSPLRIVFFKFDESMLQASCIELGDGKHAYAALRAAGTAHEP
jgi:hypothetical protein